MKMRYLLDTHTFLWMAAEPAKLSEKITGIVRASDNRLLLSAASGWEIALLWHLKRVELPDQPKRFIPEALQKLSVIPLPIGFDTAISAAILPLVHRDPFSDVHGPTLFPTIIFYLILFGFNKEQPSVADCSAYSTIG